MSVMMVDRKEDMSPNGYLRLLMESDGDMIITVVEDNELDGEFRMASVQFCTDFGGGGASPKTHKALRALMLAMAEDNRDSHMHRQHEHLGEDVIKKLNAD